MFRKSKVSDERRYKNEVIGSLVVEKTQIPHTYTTVGGKQYEIRTLNYSLRVSGYGPILFTKSYAIGKPRDMHAMQYMVRFDMEAESEFQAETDFYRCLYANWNWKRSGRESLGR